MDARIRRMQSQTVYRFTDSALRSSPSAITSTSSSTGSTAHPGNCPIAPSSPPSADSSRATPGLTRLDSFVFVDQSTKATLSNRIWWRHSRPRGLGFLDRLSRAKAALP